MSPRDARDADAFMRHFKRPIAVCVIVPAALVMLLAVWIDRRLPGPEAGLRYRDPADRAASPRPTDGQITGGDPAVVPAAPARGGTVYVPAYSHVYHAGGTRTC